MAGPDLENYNTVPERMVEFFTKYPEGSFEQADLQFVEVGGRSFVVYTAAAYRDRNDTQPGHGTAWEPIPGTTPWTKDSEVQNAETSAWGRAIIAVGAADAKKGIASREEVRNRVGESSEEATAHQRLIKVLSESGFTKAVQADLVAMAIGRRVANLDGLSDYECEVSIDVVEGAIADAKQLEEEK
jgi:hypothetical protein